MTDKPEAPLDERAKPVGKLIRGEGGAFRYDFGDVDIRAVYALPPGEHDLFAGASPSLPPPSDPPAYFVVMYGGEPASKPYLTLEAAQGDLDQRNTAYPGDQEQRRIARLVEQKP